MHRIGFAFLGLSLCGAALLCMNTPQNVVAQGTKPNVSDKDFRAFLDGQCYSCHDSESKKGGLALDKLKFDFDDPKNFDQWLRVFDRVDKGEMPPPNKPQPSAHDKAANLAYLKARLLDYSHQKQAATGRTILRRLNRVEYENTMHDLLGIDTRLQESLPEDTPQGGFDTVADGLRLSQLHIEKYLEAADLALNNAIRLDEKPEVKNQHFVYKEQDGIVKNAATEHSQVLPLDDAAVIFNDASYITKINGVNFRENGLYKFRVSGYAYQSEKPVGLIFYAGTYKAGSTRILGNFDMPPKAEGKGREVEWTARVEAGDYVYPSPENNDASPDGKNIYNTGAANYKGAGLAVQAVDIEGPLLESWPPRSVKLLFGDTPIIELDKKKQRYANGRKIAYQLAPENAQTAIRPVVERFATRAYRRPLEAGEVDGFVKLAEESLAAGASFEDALRIAFRGILVSPSFLFFEEKSGALNDYALASRLSYFLWSSMPDDELLSVAAKGELHKPEVLRAQTERMLSSPKNSLARNFAGQWLELRKIDDTTPDKKLYPEYDELLKISMLTETESFFNEVLNKNLSISNFINSDWTILNRKLAEHYGIPDVQGEQFRRVNFPEGSPRGGVLTQAAILKVTANGTTTSPVLRGSWVLKHLLGTPSPPPPPNVGSIEPDTRGATTVREQLDKHRTLPTCNSCHRMIDPPGFALESFDVIGGYRDRYRSQGKGDRPTYKFQGRGIYEYKLGLPVDASSELADGRKFSDVREFKKLLMEQQDQIARSLAGQLLTYATGASVQFSDRAAVEDVVKKARPENLGLRTLIHQVVQSEAFRSK